MNNEIQDMQEIELHEGQEKKDIILNHVITFLGVLGIIATIVLFYFANKYELLANETKMVDFLRKTEPFTPVVFFIVQFFQTVIPIMPGAITIPAGAILFGNFWGFVINYVSIVVGSITAFWLCRIYGRRLLWVLIGNKAYKRYIRLLDKPTFARIFVIGMFVPFMPADIFCMVAGVSNMKWNIFTIVLLLGKPVSLLFYTEASVYVIKWLCTLF